MLKKVWAHFLSRVPCEQRRISHVATKNETKERLRGNMRDLCSQGISRAISQKGKFGIYIQNFNLPHLNHYIIYLLMLCGQTLLVTPSLTCSFATNYHLNFPRPAPIWPCSLVGKATVICSRGHEFEPHRGQRFFFYLSPCRLIYFLGLLLRRYYLGYLLEHFNLPHLNHDIY